MKRRSDGLYQKSITIKGKKHIFYGKTKAEINRKLLAYQERQENGRTFQEVAEEWSDKHFMSLTFNSLKGIRPATNRAVEHFGDVYVKDIIPRDINNYILKYVRQGYAQKTVQTQLQVVRQIMRYAVLCSDIQYNPADSVSVPANLPKKAREVPSPQTIQFIREHTELPFALFALVALYTGARRGEVQALQYKDIDYKNKYIHVYKSVYYKSNTPYLKKPKTQSGIRDIFLLPELIGLIPKGKPNEFIFSEHGEIITNKRFETCWRKYTELLPEHITPHQLRHYYATRLYELGVDAKSAQEQLGHADIKTTSDIYTHVSEKKKKDTYKKLEDF